MSRIGLDTLTNAQLVARFTTLSLQQYGATEIDDSKTYTKLFHRIHAIESVLRKRGVDARRALLPLLAHENAQVRLNAAHELLAIEPLRARAALDALSKSAPGPQMGRAGMALMRLDSGEYKPD